MNTIMEVVEASDKFESANTELKKNYIIKNINFINMIMLEMTGFKGSFCTGYPFYALDKDLDGNLPIIEEQYRYNHELYDACKDEKEWICEECLNTTGKNMPDLKQFCKPCPKVKNSIKPRKVINRMPDVDIWMICDDNYVELTKTLLANVFSICDIHSSDINPLKTIEEVKIIADNLSKGIMPIKMLPLDVHIVSETEMLNLLTEVPFILLNAKQNNQVPYLPILPLSLRKIWQYDDEAYNFVFDYLLSLTPFNWSKELNIKYNISKQFVINSFDNDSLKKILDQVSSDSVKRRIRTKQLQKCYESRIDSWRK